MNLSFLGGNTAELGLGKNFPDSKFKCFTVDVYTNEVTGTWNTCCIDLWSTLIKVLKVLEQGKRSLVNHIVGEL